MRDAIAIWIPSRWPSGRGGEPDDEAGTGASTVAVLVGATVNGMVTSQQKMALADLYRGINAGLWAVVTAGTADLSRAEHARKLEELDVLRQLVLTHAQALHSMGDTGLVIEGHILAVVGWLDGCGVLAGGLREEARSRLALILDELSSAAGIPQYHRAPAD